MKQNGLTKTKRKKRETLLLRVASGCLVPADGYTLSRLRARGYKTGETLLADLKKPRNPGFHRFAHRFGTLVTENIEEFAGLDAHAALKRIQLEANIACDEVLAFTELEIMGQRQRLKLSQRIPRSMSFAEMEDGKFREVVRAMANHVAAEYWPSLTPEQIERMVDAMPDPA